MNLEELIKDSKKVKAPEFKKDLIPGDNTKSSFNSFVYHLKESDRKNRRLNMLQQYILLISSVIMLGMIFLSDKILALKGYESGTLKIGLIILIGAYLLSFYMYSLKVKRYTSSNYYQDVISFLTETRGRYRFFTPDRLLYIPLIFILDVGLYYSLIPFISQWNINELTLIVNIQLILVCVFSIDLLIKYKLWKKHQNPIYSWVLNLLKNFQNEDLDD